MRSTFLTVVLVVAAACSGKDDKPTIDAGPIDAPLGTTIDAKLADAPPGSTPDGGTPPLVNDAGQALCQSSSGYVVCQCSDGKNNDGDGLIDAADPECTGPQDNDESSYATGIPGDNMDNFAQDCFFDGDSGGGNDGCRWDIRCIDPPNGAHCNNTQLDGCEKCKPLVPNGCDCFGCCDVYVSGVVHTVRIIEGCTAAEINNPDKCPTCTKITTCQNTCEPCEICIGKPEPDPGCNGDAGPTGGVCPPGVFACPPPDYHCAAEERCVTGCCQPFLE